jgi:AcrR family transcriptional regulator
MAGAAAGEAGVAVPTIYYTFGTKAALFGDVLGAAIVGFDLLDAGVRAAGEEFDRSVEPVPGRAADPHAFDGPAG